MTATLLNIIVCVDPARCLNLRYGGRSSVELLQDIQEAVQAEGLEGQVKATSCRCIFGCTYGPRIDVIDRTSRQKTLYGSVKGPVTISVRGRVNMELIPEEPADLFREHLN